MTAPARVAVFGGSFNPPHVAHVLAIAYVLACCDVDRVVVVPVFEHAFDKDLAPFEARVDLARVAFGWLPGVELSCIEQALPTPSYTLQTLEKLASIHPEWALRFVVGSDVLFERDKWRSFDRIEALAPLIVLGRAGAPHPRAPAALLPQVSSTQVRALLRSPETRGGPEVAALVPRGVLSRVDALGLYR
ncbi:MAG: nicotinate-nicotinamide nucleotide adenylyltransferase [Polyangiaceae bacterium]|nr:nicotinate-nicotinamide nucleotide adenylyltransferase [Polyangiaceae bacterium]